MSALATDRPGEFSDRKRAIMLEQVSEDAPKRLGVFKAVYEGRASPRQCIKAMCLQCCWMDTKAIRDCTDTACPLWAMRPYQRGDQ